MNDASRFAWRTDRPVEDRFSAAVRAEFGYARLRVKNSRDPQQEWDKLQRKLAALCKIYERKDAA